MRIVPGPPTVISDSFALPELTAAQPSFCQEAYSLWQEDEPFFQALKSIQIEPCVPPAASVNRQVNNLSPNQEESLFLNFFSNEIQYAIFEQLGTNALRATCTVCKQFNAIAFPLFIKNNSEDFLESFEELEKRIDEQLADVPYERREISGSVEKTVYIPSLRNNCNPRQLIEDIAAISNGLSLFKTHGIFLQRSLNQMPIPANAEKLIKIKKILSSIIKLQQYISFFCVMNNIQVSNANGQLIFK